MCRHLSVLSFIILLGLISCAPAVPPGAINNVAFQQQQVGEAQEQRTFLTAEELEKLEVPENFLSRNYKQLVDILVPYTDAPEQDELIANSHYSTAIQWFESRHNSLSANFGVLLDYCSSLSLAGRTRDAFNCVNTLEKRLYHFVQSGAAEKFTTTQRNVELVGSLPVVNIIADITALATDQPLTAYAEERRESFAEVWKGIDVIKVHYYLAIRDFENAEKYARKDITASRLLSDSVEGLLGFLFRPDTALHEALLGEVLAHGDEEDRKEALLTANRIAALSKSSLVEPTPIFFALEEYQRAAEFKAHFDYQRELEDKINNHLLAKGVHSTLYFLLGDPMGAAMGIIGSLAVLLEKVGTEMAFESESYKLLRRIADGFPEFKIAYEIGEVEKARKGYEELLTIPLIGEYKDILSTIYHDLAKLEIQAGDDDKAVEHLYAAIQVIESIRANFSLETERIGFVGDKEAIYADLVATLTRQGQYAQAWEAAERAKARTLVELLAGQKRFVGTQDNAQQIEEYLEELDRAEHGGLDLAYYRNLTAEQKNTGATRGLRRIRLDPLREKIRQADATTAALVTVIPQSAEQLQQRLGSNETLVEYFGVGERYFIIIADAKQVRVIPMDAQGLEADVQAFRTAVQDRSSAQRALERRIRLDQQFQPASDTDLEAVGRRLTERWWRPIVPYIQGEQVTIVPHGPLHYLPFSALPVGRWPPPH